MRSEGSPVVSGFPPIELETINLLSFVIAFGAGVISFLSPCVLPVVPGYLSVITGLDITAATDGDDGSTTWPVARDTGLFIAGFSTVFIGLGLSASALGDVLFENQLLLTRISGFLVFVMGLFLLGSIFTKNPRFYQEARFHPDLGRYGRAAPPIAGAAFGFGWTPCIGPTLGSILLIAAGADGTLTGGALLAAYSLGLGLPFLATGLMFSRLAGAFAWVKQHMQTIVIASALSLVGFGVLLMSNKLILVTTKLQELLRSVGLEWIVNLG